MKKALSIILVVMSLTMAFTTASAAVKNTQAFYSHVDTANARVYQEPSYSATNVAIAEGYRLHCDFEPGVNALWVRVEKTVSPYTVGYMRLSDIEVTSGDLHVGFMGDGTLKKGDTGAAIGWLRAFLKKLGYNITTGTTFDTTTENVVKQFQERMNLTADGLVGPQTKDAILYAIPELAACIDIHTDL